MRTAGTLWRRLRMGGLILLLAAQGAWAVDAVGASLLARGFETYTNWRGRLVVHVSVSRPVAYAVGVAQTPSRLEIRFPDGLTASDLPEGVALTPTGTGAVLSVPLSSPQLVNRAELTRNDDGTGTLRVTLKQTEPGIFAQAAERWGHRYPSLAVTSLTAGDAPLVVIDPGHGGFDPGAQYGGIREADLVLKAAQDLQTALEARGIAATLTRDRDTFVSLPDRIAQAHRQGASALVSLHADALAVGHATGASVHSLPAEAGSAGNRFLLEFLGQDALASTGTPVNDAAARVLMDLARDETRRASVALADTLVTSMAHAGVDLYKIPRKQSNFVVLRAADMPSVLVELGFLSEPVDRARLTNPTWRANMTQALADGIAHWIAAQ